MTKESGLPLWRRLVHENGFSLLWFSVAFVLGTIGSLALLVKDPGVRNQEIAKIATLLVTVEGILVGLSPRLKTDMRRWINLGLISILVSVITVIVADTATPETGTYVFQIFTLNILI